MTWILATFAACLVLTFAIGLLLGLDRGARKCNDRWEEEWEARKNWLAPPPPLPEHGYAAPVSRRLVDAVPHPVVEPIRTEVLTGYRGRHSTDQPTGRIQRPGEITQALRRILDEAGAVTS